jgi:hypothetical protein
VQWISLEERLISHWAKIKEYQGREGGEQIIDQILREAVN